MNTNDKPGLRKDGTPWPTMVDDSKAVSVRPSVVTALTPSNMAETMRLGELMAASTLVPPGFQKKPADCLMVVMQAIRWSMDPFAVIQECSVIQGKLMYNGKLVAAVINTRGNLTKRLSYEYLGEGRERTVIVSGQLQNEDMERQVEVVLKNAATSAKVWQTQPDQQLMYHGVRVWARRHTPELMLGVWSPEEFDNQAEAVANGTSIHHPDDYADGTPERLTKPPPPKHDVSVSKESGATGVSSKMEAADAHWRQKVEGWMLAVDQIETIKALEEWASNHSIQANSMPARHRELQLAIYRKVNQTRQKLEDAAFANQVVHDSDDAEPRPATPDDFDKPTISQRAVAARNHKPDATLTPDEIADLLRS